MHRLEDLHRSCMNSYFDFVCVPLAHPRFKRNLIGAPRLCFWGDCLVSRELCCIGVCFFELVVSTNNNNSKYNTNNHKNNNTGTIPTTSNISTPPPFSLLQHRHPPQPQEGEAPREMCRSHALIWYLRVVPGLRRCAFTVREIVKDSWTVKDVGVILQRTRYTRHKHYKQN